MAIASRWLLAFQSPCSFCTCSEGELLGPQIWTVKDSTSERD